jgi:hypothetical protein
MGIPFSTELLVAFVTPVITIRTHLSDNKFTSHEPIKNCSHGFSHARSGLSRMTGDDIQRQTFNATLQRAPINHESVIGCLTGEIRPIRNHPHSIHSDKSEFSLWQTVGFRNGCDFNVTVVDDQGAKFALLICVLDE